MNPALLTCQPIEVPKGTQTCSSLPSLTKPMRPKYKCSSLPAVPSRNPGDQREQGAAGVGKEGRRGIGMSRGKGRSSPPPPTNQSQQSGLWRVSRVGSVPREEGGGGDPWMRSTSGNVRRMTGENTAPARAEQEPASCAGRGGGKAGPCVSPHRTSTHITLSPLLSPAMDPLGLKGSQGGERKARGPGTQKETLLPSKGLSEIKLMECVSVPSQGA